MSTIIDKSYVLFIKKGLLRKQNDTRSAVSKRWEYLTYSPPGASCGIVSKTGIKLVIETTWTFDVACFLPGCCIVGSASVLPDRPSE